MRNGGPHACAPDNMPCRFRPLWREERKPITRASALRAWSRLDSAGWMFLCVCVCLVFKLGQWGHVFLGFFSKEGPIYLKFPTRRSFCPSAPPSSDVVGISTPPVIQHAAQGQRARSAAGR